MRYDKMTIRHSILQLKSHFLIIPNYKTIGNKPGYIMVWQGMAVI